MAIMLKIFHHQLLHMNMFCFSLVNLLIYHNHCLRYIIFKHYTCTHFLLCEIMVIPLPICYLTWNWHFSEQVKTITARKCLNFCGTMNMYKMFIATLSNTSALMLWSSWLKRLQELPKRSLSFRRPSNWVTKSITNCSIFLCWSLWFF